MWKTEILCTMNVMCCVKVLEESFDVDIREQRLIGNEFKTKLKKNKKRAAGAASRPASVGKHNCNF